MALYCLNLISYMPEEEEKRESDEGFEQLYPAAMRLLRPTKKYATMIQAPMDQAVSWKNL